MTYDVRLDAIGRNAPLSGSSSSVLVAEHGGRTLHWGSASNHGESTNIVTLKIANLISITVDEKVVGRPFIKALQDHHTRTPYLIEAAKSDAGQLLLGDLDDRRDAALAAIAADNLKLACEIDAGTVFDEIALTILAQYAYDIDVKGMRQLLKKMLERVEQEKRFAFEDGRRAAKEELRAWLLEGAEFHSDDDR